jgi:exodeoxyribonuclease VII large subunit
MRERIGNRIEREQVSLERLLETSALNSPSEFIQAHRDELFDLKSGLRELITSKITNEQSWFKPRLAQLRTLSPMGTLARGFAIVRGKDGKLIRKSSDASVGEVLDIRVEKDSLKAQVTK